MSRGKIESWRCCSLRNRRCHGNWIHWFGRCRIGANSLRRERRRYRGKSRGRGGRHRHGDRRRNSRRLEWPADGRRKRCRGARRRGRLNRPLGHGRRTSRSCWLRSGTAELEHRATARTLQAGRSLDGIRGEDLATDRVRAGETGRHGCGKSLMGFLEPFSSTYLSV